MARIFKNWLEAYVDFAKDSEAPVKFHFWSGVSMLAGALRRRVWLDMHKFQWTPNFYIILVAPAGVVQKSTTMGVGLRLLEKVPGIHFGPESMTWQALAQALSSAVEYCEYVDLNGQLARIPMSCLTVGIGELGTFLRTDDDQLLSFLIRMWDGQADKFRHETKSSGNIEVDHPWLNLIAATTPAWLRANFPEAMVGGGLTSRIVFVYSDKKRQLVPYPDEVIPHDQYRQLEKALTDDLTAISQLAGPYILSTDARIWGRDWYTRHNDHSARPPHLASDRFGGYIARKQTHLHKFALVLAASKRDKLIIEREDLVEAEQIITSNEQDMIRVFESIGVVDEARHVNEIVTFVRNIGGQSVKDLWSRSMNFMSFVEFQAALRAAVHGNLLTMIKQGDADFVLFNASKQTGDPLQ